MRISRSENSLYKLRSKLSDKTILASIFLNLLEISRTSQNSTIRLTSQSILKLRSNVIWAVDVVAQSSLKKVNFFVMSIFFKDLEKSTVKANFLIIYYVNWIEYFQILKFAIQWLEKLSQHKQLISVLIR